MAVARTAKARIEGRASKRPELIRQTRNERLAGKQAALQLRDEKPESQHSKAQNHFGRGALLRGLDSSEGQTIAKLQAVAVGTFILWGTLPFFIPQLMFWLIGLAGLVIEANFFVGWILPGQETFFASYVVIIAIGMCSMLYAAIMFNFRGIDCFSGHKLLYFLLCLTGYFVVFLNLVPWVVFWVLAVMSESKKAKTEEV